MVSTGETNQALIASLAAYVIWQLAGRTNSLAAVFTLLIFLTRAPFVCNAIEQSITGNAGYTVAALYYTGTEPLDMEFHRLTTGIFDYRFEPIPTDDNPTHPSMRARRFQIDIQPRVPDDW